MNEREAEFRRICAASSIEVDAERDGRFWLRVEVFKVPGSVRRLVECDIDAAMVKLDTSLDLAMLVRTICRVAGDASLNALAGIRVYR